MLKISDREWKEFVIKELFITENQKGKIQLPTGSYVNKSNLQKGQTPRITVTSNNNGVDGYYSSNDKNYRIFENFISVSFLGTIFYHPYTASLDMKVHCLKLKNRKLNAHLSLFLISEIKNCIANASYGDQLSSTDLPHKKIMLPIDSENQPDYVFMEEYIREREALKRKDYIQFAINKLDYEINGGGVLIEDKNLEWKEFYLKEIFTYIQRGKRLVKEKQIGGQVPYVSSTALNNGVDGFISNSTNVRKFSHCLSLANSGSVGSAFYEPFEFIASDHVTHLKNEEFNNYHYLFLATMLKRLSQKYNFNREINDLRISREKILLPIDENGAPKLQYMTQVTRKIMINGYNNYLTYCDTFHPTHLPE